MMTAINGVMLAAGSSLAALIVVKVTVVVALGLASAWLARRSRAAVRHALLAVTFGATLALPIASLVAPAVHVTMRVAEVNRAGGPLVANTTAPMPAVTTAADGAGVAPAVPQQSSMFSLSVLLLAGWIVGTVAFLVPVFAGLWQIQSLRRSGSPWLDGQSIAETLAVDAGIHRRVEVLLHEALPGPITCGVIGPAIVLPRDAENWAREDLSRAMVHELEHVRRGDSVTRCLARAACALYWFHPLVWIAWRKLVLEAERSCDDAVLRRSEATAYADQLVGLAKRLPTAQRSLLLAMASPSDLAMRVGAVLDIRQRRGRAGRFSVALACAAAVVLVTAISPLVLIAAPQAVPAAALKFEVASIKPNQFVPPPRPQFNSCVNGRLVTVDTPLKAVFEWAYEVNYFQISDVPDWFDSYQHTYNIDAKAAGPVSEGQCKLMMRTLFEDRFKLRLRQETRDLSVWALTVAKNGPKLHEVTAGSPGKAGGGVRMNGRPIQMPEGVEPAKGWSMAQFVSALIGIPTLEGRPVVDRTGLKGIFEIELNYSPVAGGDRPEIRDAVGDLGLRLDLSKEPIEFLVIDHLEKPSEN